MSTATTCWTPARRGRSRAPGRSRSRRPTWLRSSANRRTTTGAPLPGRDGAGPRRRVRRGRRPGDRHRQDRARAGRARSRRRAGDRSGRADPTPGAVPVRRHQHRQRPAPGRRAGRRPMCRRDAGAGHRFNVGDTDGDGLLGIDETWQYTCSTTLGASAGHAASHDPDLRPRHEHRHRHRDPVLRGRAGPVEGGVGHRHRPGARHRAGADDHQGRVGAGRAASAAT